MLTLRSMFIRANGIVTGHPTAEPIRLDRLDDPVAYFRERLDPALSHYEHIACDVTDNCNLRCPFCITDFSDATAIRMTPAHFATVVQLAPLARDESVFVSCLREPLLHPGLLDLLRLIPAGLREKFFMTTNLCVRRLTDAFLAGLAGVELHHLNVSVDSLEKATFEAMRTPARHAVFAENLDRLAGAFRAAPRPPDLRFITVAARPNHAEIPSLVRAAHERYGARLCEVRFPFEDGTPAGPWAAANLLGDGEWQSLVARLAELPYWTHVSRERVLLRCGFGRQELAPAAWGADADVRLAAVPREPWHLPLQLSLARIWQPLRRQGLARAGRRPRRRPAMQVAVATVSPDGHVRLAGERDHAAFAASAVNTGAAGPVMALPRVPARLGLLATVCATDPLTGQCRTAPAPSVTIHAESGAAQTFSVFLSARAGARVAAFCQGTVDLVFLSGATLCGVARVPVTRTDEGPRPARAAARRSA